MPLKLIAPKEGRTPYWRVRGTYLGCYVHRSTGTGEKLLAKKLLEQFKGEIERGALARDKGTGFAAAAAAYMRAGGDNRFLRPLIQHFASTPLEEIDQVKIDNAAAEIYPDAITPPQRNRQVYTPMVAVLRRAGIQRSFKRPLGWQSPKGVAWLRPEQAFAVFAAADALDAEFGLFLRLLCYTGMRRSEAIADQARASGSRRRFDLLAQDKEQRGAPRSLDPRARHRAWRIILEGSIGRPAIGLSGFILAAVCAICSPRPCKRPASRSPRRQRGFHLFRHTWATWMRRYGGLDTSGLLETGAWRSRTSAARYEHLDATEEAKKADLLPTARRK